MNIKVYDAKTNETLLELKVRKNINKHTLSEKIRAELNTKYNINITRFLFSGVYDFATSTYTKAEYLCFGKDLPFRSINFVEV